MDLGEPEQSNRRSLAANPRGIVMRANLILMTAVGLYFVGSAGAGPLLSEDVYMGNRASSSVGLGASATMSPRHLGRERRSTDGYDSSYERCRITITRQGDGSVRKIRRCRDVR